MGGLKWMGVSCNKKSCMNDCSGNGDCQEDGSCRCNQEFEGKDCSIPLCPNECSFHGRCEKDEKSGKSACKCDVGYTGKDCSVKECPSGCSGHGKCGSNDCCECDKGWTGPACDKPECPATGAVAAHCCPDKCSGKGSCVDLQCQCQNGWTGVACQRRACPNECSYHGSCVDGLCQCDDDHVGKDCSKRTCPKGCAGHGVCDITLNCHCDEGWGGRDCATAVCPRNCSQHGMCQNGTCFCHRGWQGKACEVHSCPNACSDHGRCHAGICECDEGFKGNDCSIQYCPNNCNGHGVCLDESKCACDAGWGGVGCNEKKCPNGPETTALSRHARSNAISTDAAKKAVANATQSGKARRVRLSNAPTRAVDMGSATKSLSSALAKRDTLVRAAKRMHLRSAQKSATTTDTVPRRAFASATTGGPETRANTLHARTRAQAMENVLETNASASRDLRERTALLSNARMRAVATASATKNRIIHALATTTGLEKTVDSATAPLNAMHRTDLASLPQCRMARVPRSVCVHRGGQAKIVGNLRAGNRVYTESAPWASANANTVGMARPVPRLHAQRSATATVYARRVHASARRDGSANPVATGLARTTAASKEFASRANALASRVSTARIVL